MELSLSDDLSQFIRERVRTGQYAAPEDVVRAGLALLRQHEALAQLDSGELELLYPGYRKQIEEGLKAARAGKLSDGEAFFEELEREETSDTNRKSA
jgi:putative addiction module CopG family antidote